MPTSRMTRPPSRTDVGRVAASPVVSEEVTIKGAEYHTAQVRVNERVHSAFAPSSSFNHATFCTIPYSLFTRSILHRALNFSTPARRAVTISAMRFRAIAPTGLLCLVIGTALYLSRAVLDRVAVGDHAVRIAFLPAWPAWAGFVVMIALALWWLARVTHRAGMAATPAGEQPPARALMLPAFALLALALPYLPWLADAVPALQMLAGPGRTIVWLVIVAQISWVVWQSRSWHLGWIERVSFSGLTVAMAVATMVVSGAAAARLTGTVLFPAGDEPHYLIIAQSLWRDGDLAIENNHGRGDYREYYASNLDPHYLTRGIDGQIYSIHPIGLPVLLTPVYAIGGYRLVVLALLAMGAVAAAIMWRWVALALADAGAATFAWAAVVGSAPFLLNTFTVYPEIAAALAVVVAFTVGLRLDRTPRTTHGLVVGVACSALPWLSTKYAPMSAALVAVALARVWIRWPATADRRPDAGVATSAAIVAPYLLSLAGWFTFFFVYWGSPWPQAPYGAMVQTNVKNLIFGAPGLLFDQEYGLLAYAPVYILAVTGLIVMWRAGGEERRRAIEIGIVFGALLGTVGAFRIWWGGSASPGRPVASGLLLLGLPIAAAFHAARRESPRRAAQHLLLWVGIGIAAVMVVARDGMLINNDRDGSSSLLEYVSPLWEAWTLAPSFTHHEAGTALVHTLLWLAIAVSAAVALGRVRTKTVGGASLAALVTLGVSLAVVALVMPHLPNDPPQPTLDLRARSRLGALDSFDRTARPIGVIYDSMRALPAADILPMLTLAVRPDQRGDPQPIRVLHNGRFSLPAGRYHVDIRWSDRDPLPAFGSQPVGLQVGRIGPVLEQWAVQPAPGRYSQAEFSLPVDAGFVGFRGTRDVERSVAAITITPIDIVDEALRTPTPPVLAASRYPGGIVLFHDDQTFPEPSGFWTVPDRDTSITLALAPSSEPASLQLHPGPEPNRVTIATYGWSEDEELTPGAQTVVTLPDPTRRIVPLTIRTSTGFVPSERNPASGDHRRLGAWVEVVPVSPNP